MNETTTTGQMAMLGVTCANLVVIVIMKPGHDSQRLVHCVLFRLEDGFAGYTTLSDQYE